MQLILLGMLYLLAPQGSSETFRLQISVADPYAPSWVAGAVVLDMGSGEQVITDSRGIATFERAFQAGESTTVLVDKSGYSECFRTVMLPEASPSGSCSSESTFGIAVCVSPEKLYLSAPVGVAGGERRIWHPTGQTISAEEGDPTPIEYLQEIRVQVPPGALPADYRIGFTPTLAEAFNNSFMDSVGPSVFPTAQFRIGIYDLQGIEVRGLAFDPPIRVEIGSAFAGTPITDSAAPVFRFFDLGALQWSEAGIVDSGVLPGGLAFVELNHFSEVSCFETIDLVPDCFWIFDTSYRRACADPNGTALSCSNVVCGVVDGAAEAEEEIEAEVSLEDSAEAGFSETVKNKLFKLGFTAKAKVGKQRSWVKRVRVKNTIAAGINPAYAGKSGQVCIRELVTTLLFQKYCDHAHAGSQTVEFVSGTCIDTTGLADDPNCGGGN